MIATYVLAALLVILALHFALRPDVLPSGPVLILLTTGTTPQEQLSVVAITLCWWALVSLLVGEARRKYWATSRFVVLPSPVGRTAPIRLHNRPTDNYDLSRVVA